METFEKLNEDLTNQLFDIYQHIWFTSDRTIDDIKTMLNNSYMTLAFVEEGKLMAFCRVVSDGIYKAFIFDVIIKEPMQNKKLGSLLFKTLLRHEKMKGIKHIELYCPKDMIKYYKKSGFRPQSSVLLRYKK